MWLVQMELKKKTKLDMQMLINFTIDRQNYMIFEEGKKWLSPKGKPRLLIKALLQMTMETEEATERNSAPITPNWKFDISPIFSVVNIFFKFHQRTELEVYIINLVLWNEKTIKNSQSHFLHTLFFKYLSIQFLFFVFIVSMSPS